jgi:hypothetical protein
MNTPVIRVLLLSAFLSALLFSCVNKELLTDERLPGLTVKVAIHWDDDEISTRPPQGMYLNLLSQSPAFPDYGRDVVENDQFLNDEYKYIRLPYSGSFLSLCYDYYGSKNVYFANEDNELVEAYCVSMSRSTYNTRVDPPDDEQTVGEPGIFYVDRVNPFEVISPTANLQDTITLSFYPQNVMQRFTFKIRNVIGAKRIADARGAMSGMSASYFIATGNLSSYASTILFGDNVDWDWDENDEADGWITGSFYTFGRLDASNNFTIEILTQGEHYFYHTWPVTDQMIAAINSNHARPDGYDIIIDNDPDTGLPEIVDQGDTSSGGAGFDVTVEEWQNEKVVLN